MGRPISLQATLVRKVTNDSTLNPAGKHLLTLEDIRAEYGLGRELSRRIAHRIQHIKAGNKFLVRRIDLDDYLALAAEQGLDLWAQTENPA